LDGKSEDLSVWKTRYEELTFMSVEPSPQSVEPAVFKKFLIVTCHNIGGVQTRSIFEKEDPASLALLHPNV